MSHVQVIYPTALFYKDDNSFLGIIDVNNSFPVDGSSYGAITVLVYFIIYIYRSIQTGKPTAIDRRKQINLLLFIMLPQYILVQTNHFRTCKEKQQWKSFFYKERRYCLTDNRLIVRVLSLLTGFERWNEKVKTERRQLHLMRQIRCLDYWINQHNRSPSSVFVVIASW